MADSLQGLRRVLVEPETIVFVGSGVSCWSGLPSWNGFLEELSQYLVDQGMARDLVDRELAHNDLLQAASYGFDSLTKNQRREFLRRACAVDTAKPSIIHKELALLGPTSFITTNYDTLLEEGLRQWKPDDRFDKVENTSPLEVANILRATATHFVFKPHGDVTNAESVILTREDYRSFFGKNRFVLEAMKTLLATRPVVLVGFGLRDPDFLLIKDMLAETFSGGTVDHYALVSNVEEQEIDYWRRYYGIHLIGYQTLDNGTSVDRHEPLLDLLRSASVTAHYPTGSKPSAEIGEDPTSAWILQILRHLARMQLLAPPAVDHEIPIRVTLPDRILSVDTPPLHILRLVGQLASTAFTENVGHLLVTGSPGAGKTYAAHAAVASLAQEARDLLLGDTDTWTSVRIPIYVDLKTYSGDLWSLIESLLPAGLNLTRLATNGSVAFFLDAPNEIDNSYHENNHFSEDLQALVEKCHRASLVLTSRSNVDIVRSDLFDEVALDEIDRSYVEELVGETSNSALIQLLQRPLFLRMAIELEVDLQSIRLPQDLYRHYFDELARRFSEQFGQDISLPGTLGQVAFDLVNSGKQEFPGAILAGEIDRTFGQTIRSSDATSWLINERLLVPLPGNRVAFSHHLLCEYLAALHLAKIYKVTPQILSNCLRRRSWDVSLLLAVGFLDSQTAELLFGEVLRTDPVIALRATSFVEVDRDHLMRRALERILTTGHVSFEQQNQVGRELEDALVGIDNAPILLEICGLGDILGGFAAGAYLKTVGPNGTDTLIDLLLSHYEDYNFCGHVARVISGRITLDRVRQLFDQIDTDIEISSSDMELLLNRSDPNVLVSLISAAGILLQPFTVEQIEAGIGPHSRWSILRRRIVLSHLQDDGSLSALSLTSELMTSTHDSSAAVTLLFQCKYGDVETDDLDQIYSDGLLDELVGQIVGRSYDAEWAVDVLRVLAARSSVWHMGLVGKAGVARFDTVASAVISWSLGDDNGFFDGMAQYLNVGGGDERDSGLIAHCPVEWAGREQLLVDALRVCSPRLTYSLLSNLNRVNDAERLVVDLGDLDWWIDFLSSSGSGGSNDRGMLYLACEWLGQFIAESVDSGYSDLIVERFNNGDSRERSALTRYVLPHLPGLNLNAVSQTALSWLLSNVGDEHSGMESPLLAIIATEQLVEEKILPMYISSRPGRERTNLMRILRDCGARHGRRYIRADGEVLG